LNANHVRQATLNLTENATVKVAANMLGGGVSNIGTLSIGANAKFDLNANKLRYQFRDRNVERDRLYRRAGRGGPRV
jgi:hypothetical protein